MSLLDQIAEERIREAQRRGEFERLPGAGRPLVLDDDAMIPAELRMAYRILKNAGCAPPEVLARRELAGLEAALPELVEDDPERRRALARIEALRVMLDAHGRDLRLDDAVYRERLLQRFGRT